jgi:hypothetical protein
MITVSRPSSKEQSTALGARRFGHAGPLTLVGNSQPATRHRLHEELHRTLLEVQRLSEENDALRKSADIWIRMYEGQLARADRIAAELHAVVATTPVTELQAAPAPALD